MSLCNKEYDDRTQVPAICPGVTCKNIDGRYQRRTSVLVYPEYRKGIVGAPRAPAYIPAITICRGFQ